MTSGTEHDPRVDDLRQRLRALGYLDAGVNRFVLAPARDARAPWLIALFASLRIGSLAAILLGPATAIGLSARLPGLVTGPRDAVVIAIYFGVLFGLAVAGAAFVLSVLVSWSARRTGISFTRRAPLLSRVAGILVTLGCLGYLTMWWQTVIAGVGWSSPVWTASALALAAAISLLLGHAVTVGSAAVVMASAPGVTSTAASRATAQRTSRLGQWGVMLAMGLAAFGGAALLLTWSDRSTRANDTPLPLAVVPSGVKVRVIAIDGLDRKYFEGAGERFAPPALRAALNGSRVQFSNDQDMAPFDPARAWTTVGTGQPPRVHGVQSLETRRLAGIQGSVATAETSTIAVALRGASDLVRLTRPSIASGQERRSKAFWEVAASAGLNVVTINWWATWPTIEGIGTVFSDRATVRLDQGGTLDAEIAPASLYVSLQPHWTALKARAKTMAAAAVTPAPSGTTGEILLRSAELDALQILLLSEIVTPTTDLSVLYLPGLDIARYAIREHAMRTGDSSLAAVDYDSSTATALYVSALDRLLAPVIAPGSDEIILMITQPGRVDTWNMGLRMDDPGRLSARGAFIAPTPEMGLRGDAVDLAPTILYALGVPVSQDLAGKPLVDLFTREFVARYPIRYVTTYGPPTATSAKRSGQPLDQETIDRLRSLGYVK